MYNKNRAYQSNATKISFTHQSLSYMTNYLFKGLMALATIVITQTSFAQAPQKMSYQAVIRNVSNSAIINTTVGMRISILLGSASGTPVYVETQTPMTNAVGLVTTEVGTGTVISGSFSSINWSTGLYWIKTETDPLGGTAYSIFGNAQLLSVPYAFYAGSSTGNWGLTGNSGTVDGTNFIGTTDNVPLNFKVNGVIAGRIDQYYSIGNTFLGGSAGISHSNTFGDLNAAFGRGALHFNVSGSFNTSIGSQSLFYNLGSGGTSIGFESMGYIPNAAGSVAVGFRALRGHPDFANNTGLLNTAIGSNSLIDNTSGGNNSASGYVALFKNTSGSNNTAMGSRALLSNTAGSDNTAIGYAADVASGALTNATAMGSGAIVNASNTIQIGNSLVTDVYFGNPATTILHANSVVPSDARFKYNIQNNVPGLDFIKKITPVTYYFDEQKLTEYTQTGSINNSPIKPASYNGKKQLHTGFLAQDVEKVANQLGYSFDGVHTPADDKDYYSLAYSQFIMPLVKAVQEQQLQIDELKKENEKLKKLKEQVEKLTEIIQKIVVIK